MAENTKQFFQITEAARACGLSRSTLMRMEERGLLTPVFTAPDSGRRYYDNHNVARIMQIEKFKAMGLGSKEIADYFAQGGEAEVLLEALGTVIRVLFGAVSIALMAIAMLALLYDNTRELLLQNLQQLWQEICSMLGIGG